MTDLRHPAPPLSLTARIPLVALLLGSTWGSASALAADPLPYATRTRAYSAFSGSVFGDPRTVGMAGATLGLADSFTAAGDNPAGLAMTLAVGDVHASTNRIHDEHLQRADAPIHASNLGAALTLKKMGFSIGMTNVWNEGQDYRLSGKSEPYWIESFVREYRAAFAYRVHPRLSLGAQLRLASLVQTLGPESNLGSLARATDSGLGLSFGALYRLPNRRLLLGAAYSTPLTLNAREDAPTSFSALPGYTQNTLIPSRWGIGIGYVPNRLFRADFSLFRTGATPGAALLSDQSRLAGASASVDPHLGIAYTFADFAPIRGVLFAGSYLQSSRIEETPARLHLTFGLKAKWSFVNLGLALDKAASYNNTLASIGIDPLILAARLGIVPAPSRPSSRGFFPRALYESDEGLPPALQRARARTRSTGPGILEVGRQIPEKIEEKVRNLSPEQIIETLQQIPADLQEDLDEVRETLDRQEKEGL